ncbi:MAG: prolipoprotein diacylglyceryl transferase [Legionella sp.]
MLIYPSINPVAFNLGPLHIHWYGLMYLLGFWGAWSLGKWRVKHYQLEWTHEQISDLIFFSAIGVIIGGRLGYMILYNSWQWIDKPLTLFKVWEGGMAFHGGLLGVIIALLLYSYKIQKSFWTIADFAVPLVPLGLGAGRIGNFINGELWGRPTNLSWGMIFPQIDYQPRHPSQLYEFSLEGVILFIVIWWYAAKPKPTGCVAAFFLIGYSLCRLIAECFREPDAQIGYIAFNWLTMGQLLSLPMLIFGLTLWWYKHNE